VRLGTAARAAVVAVSTGAFAGLALHARRGNVSPVEERAFRTVNALPNAAHGPLWVVMQAGSLAGVGVVTAATAAAGHVPTARRLGVAGTAVWGGAKLVKRAVRRGRPGAHLADVIVRGEAQTGLGFPSGHTAVAFTLAGIAAPIASPPQRIALLAGATVVGIARQYVGAHLPADVLGGVAMGAAVAAVTARAE
jgi:glycosyltransferase 2 family protein